ncbi:MAG: hypothetical protein WBW33_15295 [Bryobacteraceae bacterium]
MRGISTKCLVLGFMIPVSSWAANRKSPDVAEQTTRISVTVLNGAAVPDNTLIEAQKQAGRILRQAGVEVEWLDCQLATNTSACTGAAEANRLQLTIVTEDNRQMFGEDVLGRSVVGGSNKGVYARVFYAHIQAKAEQEGVSPATLLGLAVAHEFGHLLLGPKAHSQQGIMRANWSHSDLQRGIQGQLRFTDQQAPLIRANVQSRMNDSLAAQPAL